MKTISKIGNRQGLFLWAAVVCLSVSGAVYSQGINRRAGGAMERLNQPGRPNREAATERPTQPGRPNREAAAAEKNQQLQAEAAPTIQAMDDQIKELLTMVNEMRRPDPARLTIAEQTLKESGRFVRKFDQNIQCEYGMLDAWLKYFRNDIPGAAIAASAAFKTDGDNNDAKITFAAMTIVSGRRPTGVVAKKEVPLAGDRNSADARRQMMEQPRNRRPNETGEQPLMATASTGNILQVDINALNLDLFEQKVPALQTQCVNSTSFSYSPGQSGLCLLFWQVRPKTFVPSATPAAGEPNQPGTANRPGQRNAAPAARRDPMGGGDYPAPMNRGRDPSRSRSGAPLGMSMEGYPGMAPGYGATGTRSTVETETAALGQLFLAHYADPDLKFLGVNTDNAAAKKEAVARMVQSPTPWAQVFASDPKSGLGQFAKVEAEVPILAIADKTGAIRYAGPAAGFLAPMVLEHLGGLGSAVPSAAPAPAVPTPAAPKPAAPVSPAAPKPQSATPAVPANTVPKPKVSISLEDIEPTEEELENDPSLYEAAKKVEYAKTLFIPAGQKRFMTSKNGVETCREILRRWPNTKYAELARQLLRKIPEDEQKRYKITNEELGL
jgi:hypothetical protein